jgi:Ca2+-transporting ATPase
MKRRPLPPEEPVVTRALAYLLGLRGVIEAAVVLGAFLLWLKVFDVSEDEARTVALSTIVVAELLMAHASRSIYHTAFDLGVFKNPHLWAATLACLGLLVMVIYVGPLQDAFHTESLGLREWAGAFALGCIPLLAIEAFKLSPWRLQPPGQYTPAVSTVAEPGNVHAA